MAGRTVSAGWGSPSHVRTANDGPLQAGRKVTACPSDTIQVLLHNSNYSTATRHQDEFTVSYFR